MSKVLDQYNQDFCFVFFVLFQGTDHYFSGGGGWKILQKKNHLEGLKRLLNRLLANMICITKIVCIEVRETCNQLMKKKNSKLKFRLKVCSCL